MAYKVNKEQCVGCGTCIQECPVGVIAIDDDGLARITDDECIECGACKDVCPCEAISL